MESHRLLLGVIVAGILVLVLSLGRPSITGFVPTETFSQSLDIDVFESERFVLSSIGALKLSSLSLSGEVFGSGLVNVYLSDGDSKWLVFSNKKKKGSSMEHITGFAVGELNIAPGGKLDVVESLPDGYVVESGVFSAECLETCILDKSLFEKSELFLDVVIDPGAQLHISEIRFSTIVD